MIRVTATANTTRMKLTTLLFFCPAILLSLIMHLLTADEPLQRCKKQYDHIENHNKRRCSTCSKLRERHRIDPIDNRIGRIQRSTIRHNIDRLEYLHRRYKGRNDKE